MQHDLQTTDEQIAGLREVRRNLDKEPLSRADIEFAKKDIVERVEKLQSFAVKKMIRHIVLLIRNARSESDIEDMVKDLVTRQPVRPHRAFAAVYRTLVLSFLFGMLLGPIFALSRKHPVDPVEYGWYGALSLSMFGLVMSLLKKLDMNGKPLAAVNAGVVGAAAGAVAYLVWGAFSFDQPLSAYWAEGLKNSLIGARFGVGISLTLPPAQNHALKAHRSNLAPLHRHTRRRSIHRTDTR